MRLAKGTRELTSTLRAAAPCHRRPSPHPSSSSSPRHCCSAEALVFAGLRRSPTRVGSETVGRRAPTGPPFLRKPKPTSPSAKSDCTLRSARIDELGPTLGCKSGRARALGNTAKRIRPT
ncbi:hypothetical protein GQ55_5G061400 [Panicum hallii var. hallii]|uniref:Uncharacterized protein n=1 Tax=Panicum hallii var. hallii TaxID=1504633 RepID=A0A2T7DDA8_9POAL|nr:hypothetical protein GQ55_5G061400 [Panicum hallii var. hallii]